MRHEGGVMKMRRLDALELPAGQTVSLEPGGFHIMLLDIRQPLKAGEVVKVTLIVEGGGERSEVQVSAPVRSLTGEDAHQHH